MMLLFLLIIIAMVLYACYNAFKCGFMDGYLKGKDDTENGRKPTFKEFIRENKL